MESLKKISCNNIHDVLEWDLYEDIIWFSRFCYGFSWVCRAAGKLMIICSRRYGSPMFTTVIPFQEATYFSPHSFSILLLIYLDVVRIACFFLREDTSAAGTSCTWRARARREAWWSRSFLVQSEYRRRFIHSWSVANAYPRIEVLRSGSVTQLQFMHINS